MILKKKIQKAHRLELEKNRSKVHKDQFTGSFSATSGKSLLITFNILNINVITNASF